MVEASREEVARPVRAQSFGAVAEQYERYRPGYPEDLVDVVFEYAGRPVITALEVGAGTGKATRLFAARGVQITALEPDPGMAGVLRRTTAGLPVTSVVTTFEHYQGSGCVDLIFAAAAWHWTDPATRMGRTTDLLAPGGVLALFGASADPMDPDLRAAVEAIEAEMLPVDDTAEVHPWSLEELNGTHGLLDVTQLDRPRCVTRTADDFVGRLATVSAYLLLTPKTRTDVLSHIRSVLPTRFEVDATIQLTLARRA